MLRHLITSCCQLASIFGIHLQAQKNVLNSEEKKKWNEQKCSALTSISFLLLIFSQHGLELTFDCVLSIALYFIRISLFLRNIKHRRIISFFLPLIIVQYFTLQCSRWYKFSSLEDFFFIPQVLNTFFLLCTVRLHAFLSRWIML